MNRQHEPMRQVYRVRLRTLSPLHIGSGTELRRGYDYICDDQRTYVLHEERLFERLAGNAQALTALAAGASADELLQRRWLRWQDLQGEGAPVRYVLPGVPVGAAGNPAALREQIKDVYDRPYVPGSSLKGALRTALLVEWRRQHKGQVLREELGRNKQSAARALEKEAFGPDPNHDVLRALQVGDSEPAANDCLQLAQVRVYPGGGRGARQTLDINVECVRAGTELSLEVRLDLQWLHRDDNGLADASGWERLLRDLPRLLRNKATLVLRRETAFYRGRADAAAVGAFYTRLGQAHTGMKSSQRALVPVGWGSGWEAKTLGADALESGGILEAVIQEYGLARGSRKEDDPFPKSRKLALQGERPASPLGWLEATFAPG